MKIQVIGKNVEVTEGIKGAVEERLLDLRKYFSVDQLEANVVVRTYKVGQKVEVSLAIDPSHTIRQEVTHDDLYAAIDIVGKKLEKQIRRFKDRAATMEHKKMPLAETFNLESFTGEAKPDQKITRRKTLENKPMSEAEAILQFELVGHDFFAFEDFNDNKNKILYKRSDKDYGIIVLD